MKEDFPGKLRVALDERNHREANSRQNQAHRNEFGLVELANHSTNRAALNEGAAHPGPIFPKYCKLLPPMKGPKIKPRPKAMPISPIFFDRSSGGVISAM